MTLLVINFIHISVYMSIPIAQFITPPSPPLRRFPPLVSIRLNDLLFIMMLQLVGISRAVLLMGSLMWLNSASSSAEAGTSETASLVCWAACGLFLVASPSSWSFITNLSGKQEQGLLSQVRNDIILYLSRRNTSVRNQRKIVSQHE